MTIHNHQHKHDKISGGSALLAGLGVDPARLLPYLAASNHPIPGIVSTGNTGDHAHNGMRAQDGPGHAASPGVAVNPPLASSRIVATPAATPPASSSASIRTPLPQLDQTELSKRLAPFHTDVLPLSRATSSGVRDRGSSPPIAASSNASGHGFASRPPFDPAPGQVKTGFGFGSSHTVSEAWSRPAAFGVDTVSTSSVAAGDPSAIETRLARVVERLERIAEQLDQSGAPGRDGPSRSFRGRVDS